MYKDKWKIVQGLYYSKTIYRGEILIFSKLINYYQDTINTFHYLGVT